MSGGHTKFERVGSSYRLRVDAIDSTLTLRHMKRRSGELHGTLSVRTGLQEAKTFDGDLLIDGINLNLASWQSHGTMANRLAERAATGKEVDWLGFIDELCIRAAAAEESGDEPVEVGEMPVVSPHARWAIEPLAIRQSPSVIYGAGGTGKSFLAYALAMSVRLGREIVPGCPPAIKGNVIYLDWETNAQTANDRIRAIAAGAGVSGGTITYRRMRRPLSDTADEVAEFVGAKDAVFVVLDSTERSMGAKSEHSDLTDSVMRLYEAIDLMGPVTVLLLDHIPKSDLGSHGRGNGPIGAVAKENAARLTWRVSSRQMSDGMEMSLHIHKHNDVLWHPPIGLRFRVDENGATFEASSPLPQEDDEVQPYSPPVTLGDRIYELLDDPQAMGMRAPDIAKTLNVAPDSIRKALGRDQRFVRNGEVWAVSRGVPLRSAPGDPDTLQ